MSFNLKPTVLVPSLTRQREKVGAISLFASLSPPFHLDMASSASGKVWCEPQYKEKQKKLSSLEFCVSKVPGLGNLRDLCLSVHQRP